MTDMRLLLLGSPQVIVDGRPSSFGRRKDFALLAYLAVTGERQSRDMLATLLWPDADQSRARAALRKAVYRLNRQIVSWLDVDPETIGLVPGYSLDVNEFRRLVADGKPSPPDVRAAANLYRGDFMAGFTLPDCPEFDRWHFFQADELRHALMNALTSLIDHYVLEGQYEDGIVAGRRLLSLDPLHEPVHRRLMQCYTWTGQRSAALRQYRDCIRLLEEELGVPPDPETTALCELIKSRQLSAPARSGTAVTAVVPSFVDLRTLIPLVGRHAERDQIVALVRETTASRGKLLLVEGEPGIGKSRLLQEAIAVARQHKLNSIWLNCYRVEQDIPYQPVAELVDQALTSWSPDTFQALPPSSLAEIATLVPEFASVAPGLPTPPPGLDEARRARLFRSLGQLVEALAKPHGLLIVTDDVHWADHATLQFLHYLARRLAGQRFLLICSFRSGVLTENPELAVVLDGLMSETYTSSIRLARLSAAEASEFAERVAPSAGSKLSHWLFSETDGNPLFLNSILQSLPGEVLAGGVLPEELDTASKLPGALLESIRDRLRWLPETSGHILEFAAVIGRRFSFDLLRALTGESTLALLKTVETLVQRQLLHEDSDGRYDFTHDKIREVIYQDLNQMRRRLLHKMVAETMEQRESHRLREVSGVLSGHFEQAGDWDKAIAYLTMAAGRAGELYALQEANSAYSRALELAETHANVPSDAERLELFRKRGEVRALLADFEGAVDDLQGALERARRLQLPGELTATLLQLGMILRRSDDYEGATHYLAEALAAAESAGDERKTAEILFHLGTIAFSRGDNLQSTDYHHRAVSIVQRLSLTDRVAMQALHGRAESFYLEGNQPEADRFFRRSLNLARRLGDKSYEAENLQMLAAANSVYMGGADYAQARRYGEQALAICREYHLDWHLMPTLTSLGSALAATGAYQDGLDLARQAVELAQQLRTKRYWSVALNMVGYLLLDLNLWTEAAACQEQAIAIAEPVRAGQPLFRARALLALTRLRAGRLEAGEELMNVLEVARRYKRGVVTAHCLAGLAEWAVQAGDADAAADNSAQLLSLGQAGQMPEMIVQAYLWQGESKRLSGDLAGAAEAFNWAAARAEKIGRVRLQWDVQEALARLYARQGRRELAQQHADEVRSIVNSIIDDLSDHTLRTGLLAAGYPDSRQSE